MSGETDSQDRCASGEAEHFEQSAELLCTEARVTDDRIVEAKGFEWPSSRYSAITMTFRRKRGLGFLALSLALSSCHGLEPGGSGFLTRCRVIERKAALWVSAWRNPVIARVGNTSISASDLRRAVWNARPEIRRLLASPDGRLKLLNALIDHRLKLLAAKTGTRQDGSTLTTPEDEKRILGEYKPILRETTLKVTDEEVRQSYESRLADYTPALQIKTSHILLPSMPDALRAQTLLKKGRPFGVVARQMSADRLSAEKGGRIAPFTPKMVGSPFDQAAAALEKNQVSGIVATPGGFELIRRDGEIRSPPRPFEQVKDEIRVSLEQEKYTRWLAALRLKTEIRIDQRKLVSLDLPENP